MGLHMDIDKATYDGSATAEVTGLSGLFNGSKATIRLGQCLVVGRSRMCGLSVARAEECIRLSKVALESHKSYRKISRQHFRICLVSVDRVEVEDLSTNGTVVNGFKIDRIAVDGFSGANNKITIQFGHGEVIEIIATGATRNSSEAATEQKALPKMEPEKHLSGYDHSHTPVP
ncbi:MAG: pSer/pThr/pTyr-binding forkhead associated (FHA) protein [Planctomycetota bacterium]|jgi:pSer/pThr/pTyr-binding forkhead associated (FHA) protein